MNGVRKDPQRPSLRVLPGSSTSIEVAPDAARREAYASISEGYRAALNVDGLSDEDAARFRRSLRLAEVLAGLSHVRRHDA